MKMSKSAHAMHRLLKFSHIIRVLPFLIFLSPMLSGCALNVTGDARLPNHIVMLDEKGGLVDIGKYDKCRPESRNCRFSYSELKHEEGKERIARKIEELSSFEDNKNFCKNSGYGADEYRRFPSLDPNEPDKDIYEILIFVHGGLNTQNATLERAAHLFPQILCNGGAYPIFINWDSSLFSSYGEHLLNVRQGTHYDFFHWQTLLTPTVFATDIARSIIRAPIAWAELFSNDFQGSIFHRANNEHKMLQDLLVEERSNSNNNIKVSSLDQKPDFSLLDTLWSTTTYLLTLPTKLASVPFIDAFGTSAWSNMQRRTQMLFHTQEESEFNSKIRKSHRQKISAGNTNEKLTHLKGQGGLSLLVQELINKLSDGSKSYNITIVGHSAGSIILNQLIREFGPAIKKAPALKLSKIVYIAPASTIQDYRVSIWPYLRLNPEAKFYNLMLHNKAESQDSTVVPFPLLKEVDWDPGPRGSLLVWVDAFLSNPKTLQEHTLGQFTNIMKTIQSTPRDVRGQIFLKIFNAGGEYDPKHHGGFADKLRFWDEDCLDPKLENERECWSEKP